MTSDWVCCVVLCLYIIHKGFGFSINWLKIVGLLFELLTHILYDSVLLGIFYRYNNFNIISDSQRLPRHAPIIQYSNSIQPLCSISITKYSIQKGEITNLWISFAIPCNRGASVTKWYGLLNQSKLLCWVSMFLGLTAGRGLSFVSTHYDYTTIYYEYCEINEALVCLSPKINMSGA